MSKATPLGCWFAKVTQIENMLPEPPKIRQLQLSPQLGVVDVVGFH